MLEEALAAGPGRKLDPVIQQRLAASVTQDIQELRPHLESQGKALEGDARRRLELRGKQEAEAMAAILVLQKKRIQSTQKKESQELLGIEQPLLPGMHEQVEAAKRQLQSNRKHWEKRLAALDQEAKVEPARIRELYEVHAARIEPVGLVYLFPQNG